MAVPLAAALIAAAGSGERLGAGGPKALAEVGGTPMLAWSLRAMHDAASVEGVVVAAPPGYEDEVRSMCRAGEQVVPGGATRAESVAAALGLVPAATPVVAVHDAARPLLTGRLADQLVAALNDDPEASAVIAAAPLVDTIKRVGETRAVAETLDRSLLWAAQTPQVFRAQALRDVLALGGDQLRAATDEATLVEQAGGVVRVMDPGAPNLKVTTPADLRLAELLIGSRET